MARARNIKPGLFKNEILGVADPLYTLLFEGLWLLADREGRLEDRPLRIKAEIFPYREGLDIEAMLNWLAAEGFITRYTAHGVKCIFIEEFVKHQNPHKNEPDSSLPAPEFAEPNTGFSGGSAESIGTTSEKIGSAPADSLIPDSLIPDNSPRGEVVAKPKRPAKPKPEDHPQAGEVLDYLNTKAATVAITSTVGQGFPDICVGYNGRSILMEVKDGSKPPSERKLTPGQKEFHAAWRGEITVVTSAAEAVDYLLRG